MPTKTWYQNKVDYKPVIAGMEVNEEPSQTIPGEALTIAQIIQKYTSGMIERKDVQYIDQEDMDLINQFYGPPGSLDLTDLDALKEHTKHLQSVVKEAEKRKADEEKEKKMEEESKKLAEKIEPQKVEKPEEKQEE